MDHMYDGAIPVCPAAARHRNDELTVAAAKACSLRVACMRLAYVWIEFRPYLHYAHGMSKPYLNERDIEAICMLHWAQPWCCLYMCMHVNRHPQHLLFL